MARRKLVPFVPVLFFVMTMAVPWLTEPSLNLGGRSSAPWGRVTRRPRERSQQTLLPRPPGHTTSIFPGPEFDITATDLALPWVAELTYARGEDSGLLGSYNTCSFWTTRPALISP